MHIPWRGWACGLPVPPCGSFCGLHGPSELPLYPVRYSPCLLWRHPHSFPTWAFFLSLFKLPKFRPLGPWHVLSPLLVTHTFAGLPFHSKVCSSESPAGGACLRQHRPPQTALISLPWVSSCQASRNEVKWFAHLLSVFVKNHFNKWFPFVICFSTVTVT